jgi:hypothetical protein
MNDRRLITSTAKHRFHALFRQGCMIYNLIPAMPEGRTSRLIPRFSSMLQKQPLFAERFWADLTNEGNHGRADCSGRYFR